jgi:hypothetical protein
MSASLPLQGTVGFAGGVRGGVYYVDSKLVYPVGATLVVRDLQGKQEQVCLPLLFLSHGPSSLSFLSLNSLISNFFMLAQIVN